MCGSVAKLSAVAYGAVAMLAQGLLSPPSDFVPVLPPGLKSLLQKPSPYLIGVLTGPTPNYINLRNVPNIGEVVLFDLDNQQGNEAYFHNIADPQRAVPDLTRRDREDLDVMASSPRFVTIADVLYQDLAETLKADKKAFWQGAVQEKLGLAAAKGKKAASAAVKKGLKYLKKRTSGEDSERATGARGADGEDGDDDAADFGDGQPSPSRLVGKENYDYNHGYSNVETEVEARIAFGVFFLGLLGDLKTYLTQQLPGTAPVVDKPKFMKHRAANGDVPSSGMFFLLTNFLRGRIFDSFVEARLAEFRAKRVVAEDAPLFAIVANHHRINRMDFGLNHVRPSVRRIATDPYLPGNYLIKWNRSVRGRASELTSAQTYNGDWNLAVAQLTQDCRESSAILIDTMMVLWSRLQEGRGMQWKKALLALQILRNLLLNGPINAIVEAIDGFASIRILKSYAEALRAQNSKLVRDVAVEIYSLVVDLPVLFARRRELMNRRRLAKDPKPSPLRKETRMIKGIGQFRSIHIALRPAGATVAPAPTPVNDLLFQEVPSAAPTGTANVPASGVSQSGNYSSDLLSWSVAPTPLPQVAASNNNTAVGSRQMPQTNAPTPTNYSSDLLALSFAPSPSPQVVAPNNAGVGEPQQPDPFTMQEMSQAVSPKAVPPPAAKDPLSQPTSDLPSLSFGTSPSPQITAANNAANGEQKKPDPFTMQAISQATPTTGPPVSSDPRMNPSSKQGRLLPMLNTTFSMANNSLAPTSAQTQQHSQTMTKSPMTNQSPMYLNPTQQGGHFSGVNPPPQRPPQQTWGNATTFAQNGYQATQPMHSTQGNFIGVPPTGYQMPQQGAPPFQQGTNSQLPPGVPPNAYGNVQKK